MRCTRIHHFLLAAIMAASAPLFAGGYLIVTSGGVVYKWSASPITVRLDQGTLGAKSNAAANALAVAGLNAWSSANNTISFSFGSPLPVDNNGSSLPGSAPQTNELSSDGITPVIYDTDGTITDFYLGGGASSSVLGFAGPQWTSGTTIVEGQAVMNGLFVDGLGGVPDVSDNTFQGVFTHEIGHMLNLDHTQFNDHLVQQYTVASISYANFPTMYPIVSDDNMTSPELDDQYWLANLYPSGSFTANTFAIDGLVQTSAGANINGINVVARRADDTGKALAVTCVSGFDDGTPTSSATGHYKIPGLPLNTQWVVTFEPVNLGFDGGSSVGPLDPPISPPSITEYLNETGIESNADITNRSTTFSSSTAGTISPPNFTLNTTIPTSNTAEVDAGRALSAAQAITVTPGNRLVITGSAINSEATGTPVTISGDPYEDWYYLSVPAGSGGFKVNRVTLTDNTGNSNFNLLVASFDQANGQIFFPGFGLSTTLGGSEDTFPFMDSTLSGSGTAAGRIYVGVSHATTSAGPGGNYTVTIDTSASEADMVAIDSVTGTIPGTLTIAGRGFKNTGGVPAVTLSDPDVVVGTVTYVSATQVTVATTLPSGTLDVSITAQLTNSAGSGSFAGRRSFAPVSSVDNWQLL